jgi:hypothetical protein
MLTTYNLNFLKTIIDTFFFFSFWPCLTRHNFGGYLIIHGNASSMREWILLFEGLPTVVRMHPDLLATFSFYFILFITYKIIQYSRTVAGKWKHCITTLVDPYFSRAFQWYQVRVVTYRVFSNGTTLRLLLIKCFLMVPS